MRNARIACSSALLILGLLSTACSDGALGDGSGDQQDQHASSIATKRRAAEAGFADELDQVYDLYATCQEQLTTSSTCVLEAQTGTQSFRIVLRGTPQDLLGRGAEVLRQIREIFNSVKNNICGVLQNFQALQHPYFFYGASGTVGVGVVGQGGADVVFDMWNNQAAVFYYGGGGIASMVGGEVGGYMGYGFGNKANVLDAWSGTFITGSLSGQLPVLELAAGGSAFGSPDGSVFGGAVNISIGLDALPTPIDGSLIAGKWTGWDGGTSALAGNGWFINQKIVRDPATGRTYIQYASSRDMALALLWNAPQPMGATAAAQTIALGMLRDSGLTIEQMCPSNKKVPPPKFTPKKAANNGNGGQTAEGGEGTLSKTDCGDKSDGWWCLDTGTGVPWMAYCSGKQISGGCGCGACTTNGVKASCSASPPPAACPSN